MHSGRLNIRLGIVVMITATFGGFALGNSLDPYFEHGYAQIPFWRYLMKAGHTHGMPFGLINIVFGMLISRLTCSDRVKTIASILTATAILLPLGVFLRGVSEGAKWAEAIAVIGGFSLLGACVSLLVGLGAKDKSLK